MAPQSAPRGREAAFRPESVQSGLSDQPSSSSTCDSWHPETRSAFRFTTGLRPPRGMRFQAPIDRISPVGNFARLLTSSRNSDRGWLFVVDRVGSAQEGGSKTPTPAPNHTMRIAQIAPLAESVPPKLYGGTERVVAWLVDELVGLGHEVTLFASGDSRTRASLYPAWPQALRLGRPRTDPAAAYAALL